MFNVGDRVASSFGNEGTVHSLSVNGMFVMIKFDGQSDLMVVYPCGRLHKWHDKPIIWRI